MSEIFSSSFYKTLVLSAFIFVLLDLLWLAVIARPFYLRHFGYLATVENGKIVFNLYAGIAAQFIISAGLTTVITLVLNQHHGLAASVFAGAFAGFVIYATYDLTNLSFVKGYTFLMSAVDIAWGTAQGVFAGVYVYFLSKFFS